MPRQSQHSAEHSVWHTAQCSTHCSARSPRGWVATQLTWTKLHSRLWQPDPGGLALLDDAQQSETQWRNSVKPAEKCVRNWKGNQQLSNSNHVTRRIKPNAVFNLKVLKVLKVLNLKMLSMLSKLQRAAKLFFWWKFSTSFEVSSLIPSLFGCSESRRRSKFAHRSKSLYLSKSLLSFEGWSRSNEESSSFSSPFEHRSEYDDSTFNRRRLHDHRRSVQFEDRLRLIDSNSLLEALY